MAASRHEIPDVHRFYVHARDQGSHAGHLAPGATSLLDAAMIFVEHWAGEAGDGAGGELTVIVRDRDTGEQQCFVVDLDSGETAPCA